MASRVWLGVALCSALGVGCSKDSPAGSEPSASAAGTGAAASSSTGAGAGKSAANGGGAGQAGGPGGAAAARAGQGAPAPLSAAGASGKSADAGSAAERALEFKASAIASDLAKAVCDALRACLGDQKLAAFVGREPCETRLSASFAQQDFASLEDAARSGAVKVTPDLLQACYDDTRALGCKVQSDRLPTSCQRAIAGQAKQGEACSTGADCGGETFCPTGACPRVCTPRGAAAASCKRDDECVNGLICLSERCAAPAAVGEACAGGSGGVCSLGTSCVGSTKSQAGKCMRNADVQVGELGDACTPGGALCQEGLSCAYDGGNGFGCQAAAGSGSACHLALPGQCPADEYCTAEDVMSEGTCKPLPVEGSACVVGSECAGGHVCLADASGKGVCWKIKNLGETCTQDATCRSERCSEGRCAAPATCD